MDWLMDKLKKNKAILLYILTLFVVTRIVLVLIGSITLRYLSSEPYQNWRFEIVKESPLKANWTVWDSRWYLKIAEEGYSDVSAFLSDKESSFGFFPLYPSIIKLFQTIFRDYIVAGIIVSNIFLLISAFLLYLLIKSKYNEDLAYRGVLYMFLFPAGYIFSAVYPMSLVLCLWLACILVLHKKHLFLSGIFGFLACLAHPFGVLVLIPAFLIYIKDLGYSWKSVKLNGVFLFLIPLGLLFWGMVNYYMTGDFFAYSTAQQNIWGHSLAIPFVTLYKNLWYGADYLINSLITLAALIFVIISYKKIPFSYWLFAIFAILFCPLTGTVVGSLRYFSMVFPIFILLALWSKNERVNQSIIITMAMLQGFLFVYWTLGFWFIS